MEHLGIVRIVLPGAAEFASPGDATRPGSSLEGDLLRNEEKTKRNRIFLLEKTELVIVREIVGSHDM